MKRYTLYYQPQASSDRTIAVATSDSLLKLCKIKRMTFRNYNGFPYIIKTEDFGNIYAFIYGVTSLFDYEFNEIMRFNDKVNRGKYYMTYDYSQRVRKLLNRG